MWRGLFRLTEGQSLAATIFLSFEFVTLKNSGSVGNVRSSHYILYIEGKCPTNGFELIDKMSRCVGLCFQRIYERLHDIVNGKSCAP